MPLRSGSGQIEAGAEEYEAPSLSWGWEWRTGALLHTWSRGAHG